MKKHQWLLIVSLLAISFFLLPGTRIQPVSADPTTPACLSLATEHEIHQFDNAQNNDVEQAKSAVWSPDGKKIAVWVWRWDITKIISDPENWIQVWDVTTNRRIVELPIAQYTSVRNIVWSNDSTKLAVSFANHIRIWEGGTDWTSPVISIKDRSLFIQVIWLADATQLYSASTIPSHQPKGTYQYGNVLSRWDAVTGTKLEESPIFDQVFLTSNGTQQLIIFSLNNQLSLRDAQTDQVLWSKEGVYLAGSVFNGQIQRIATLIHRKEGGLLFSVWDIPSGQDLLDMPEKTYRYPYLNFAPQGNILENDLDELDSSEFWNIETGQKIQMPAMDGYVLRGAVWSPQGDCAISTVTKFNEVTDYPQRYAILLWGVTDPPHGRILAEGHYDSLAWSPDGKQLAVLQRMPILENPISRISPSPGYSSKLVIWSPQS